MSERRPLQSENADKLVRRRRLYDVIVHIQSSRSTIAASAMVASVTTASGWPLRYSAISCHSMRQWISPVAQSRYAQMNCSQTNLAGNRRLEINRNNQRWSILSYSRWLRFFSHLPKEFEAPTSHLVMTSLPYSNLFFYSRDLLHLPLLYGIHPIPIMSSGNLSSTWI